MKFPSHTVQSRFDSPLGPMLAAASEQGLCGLWFAEGQRHLPDMSGWPVAQQHPVLLHTQAFMQAYFEGDTSSFNLPLDLRSGTEFQQAVWQALLRIPSGASTTYGTLSFGLGRPSAVRAVAGAVGRNPISVIVPCHRVLGSDGSLTGYAGGLERKTALLQLEAKHQAVLL